MNTTIDLSILQFQIIFEHLVSQFYTSTHVDNSGKLLSIEKMNKEKFKDLLEKDISSIECKLQPLVDIDVVKSIVDAMKNAYIKTKGEQRREFLTYYGITLTKDRKDAIDNVMNTKHATSNVGIPQYIKDYIVYRDYISEIILKIFGYSGEICNSKPIIDGLNKEIESTKH